ncbi:alkaline phosphatase PhoX [Pseudemcibacter aquimaris]|uniref:alkaline phosphatase PhoX n=1 Tax=Pseudemcibacter aquimaris TaxID=2857064 RepID=UPI002010F523|nr:alkaline phosphatase PhoX [Pseudemcibacter aquimaris]MCC3861456.1 DUF839 domain-containing protein [Pseudemcibacter aquimaris]WDU58225.1 DUF839 domain-containing protein [Pseudemcibacter aquimaris]
MKLTRRKIVIGASALAFTGLALNLKSTGLKPRKSESRLYGPLIIDPDGILDLPSGFEYKVISELNDVMDDGYHVPDRADGMGCIPLDGNKVALIKNHEIRLKSQDPVQSKKQIPLLNVAYDKSDKNEPHPGGTTTLIYDMEKGVRLNEYRSLIGTLNNCAGGVTPWGSWLSCEENVTKAGDNATKDHGWVFEVPANMDELSEPVPLKAMGRFNHEAAAVDPKTGIVYMTEDRPNSLFYRFIPNEYGKLDKGGTLQALALMDAAKSQDSRNWETDDYQVGEWFDTRWVDLEDIESPNDDLRIQGFQKGGVIFARGEGIHWGDNELYFCCTSGGNKNLGQIMRYQPSEFEGTPQEGNRPGKLQLFFESTDPSVFNYGDNITVAPNGHLFVCEDQYTAVVDNHLVGITPTGEAYSFGKLRLQTELAGVCFSPDGSTMFINVYQPTKTLAITGPWDQIKA